MKTAVQILVDNLENIGVTIPNGLKLIFLEKEKEQMIDFHKWMLKNDTAENAEQYFHYSDDDMFNEYLKQAK